MKKLIAVMISVTLILSASSVAYAGDYTGINYETQSVVVLSDENISSSGTCGDNLSWTLSTDGILTISGTGSMDTWPLPYYPGWYSSRLEIKSVVIDEGVETIGDWAFQNCDFVESISIPSTVTEIGEGAFSVCPALKEIVIPENVTKIENGLFYNSTSLKKVSLPKNISAIPAKTFYGCSALTDIELSDNITTIGLEAFYGCSSLASVNFISNVTTIGKRAFLGCLALQSISIPEGVTVLNEAVFSGCTGLTSVEFHSKLKTIGVSAFADCTALKSVVMPDSVTTLGTGAFSGCSGLTSVVLSSGVSTVGESAFDNCTKLTDVTIPEGVKKIGVYSFRNCSSLENVVLADSVTSTSKGSFISCTALKEVYLPEGFKTLGSSSFSDCSSLKEIEIPSTVTSVGISAFSSCTGLEKVTINEGVTSISSSMFYNCTSLESIIIPSSVSNINSSSFDSCTGLKYAVFLTTDATVYTGILEGCKNAMLYCYEGSTIETYAVDNSLSYTLIKELNGSLTSSEQSVNTGTEVTFTASAENAIGEAQYKFYYVLNGNNVLLQDYSENASCTFTPDVEGGYTVYADVKDLREIPVTAAVECTVEDEKSESNVFVFKINDNNVLYANQNIKFPVDAPAQLVGGKTLVPLRAISSAVGIDDLIFDSETFEITFTGYDGYTIEMTVDSTVCTLTKDGVSMDITITAPVLIDGITMLPLRDATALVGGTVKFDDLGTTDTGYVVVSGGTFEDADVAGYIDAYEAI